MGPCLLTIFLDKSRKKPPGVNVCCCRFAGLRQARDAQNVALALSVDIVAGLNSAQSFECG